MEIKKQFSSLVVEIIEIENDEIIATSGEKLTDSLFGKGKGGVNVG